MAGISSVPELAAAVNACPSPEEDKAVRILAWSGKGSHHRWGHIIDEVGGCWWRDSFFFVEFVEVTPVHGSFPNG